MSSNSEVTMSEKSVMQLLDAAQTAHRRNDFNEAILHYREILERDQKHADAIHYLGMALCATGEIESGLEKLHQAMDLHSGTAVYHHNLGIVLSNLHRLPEAITAWRRALALAPNHVSTLLRLGEAIKNTETEETVTYWTRALELEPDNELIRKGVIDLFTQLSRLNELIALLCRLGLENVVDELYRNWADRFPKVVAVHLGYGEFLVQQKRLDDAIFAYKRATEIDPAQAQNLNNWGNHFQKLADWEGACLFYQAMSEVAPNNLNALCNLGNVAAGLNRWSEAIRIYRDVLQRDPDFVDAQHNLSIALFLTGDSEQALAACQKTLSLAPDSASAWNNLGNCQTARRDYVEAEAAFKRSLSLQPRFQGALQGLMGMYAAVGNVQGVAWCQEQLPEAVRNTPSQKLRDLVVVPALLQSTEEGYAIRQHMLQKIESLLGEEIAPIPPSLSDGPVGNFFLAYHGDINDRQFQQIIAKAHMVVYQGLDERAPHCRDYRFHGERIRVGICSNFLKIHTIGRLNFGLIARLPREQFQVVVIHLGTPSDVMRDQIDQLADEVCFTAGSVLDVREVIAQLKLDVLFYPDIGMHPMQYLLAFSRLAPVQCATFGHPITTGIPNIDYFISSHLMEPENAFEHYSEQLVLLNYIPTYYLPVPIPPPASREEFDCPAEATLYLCPQTLFKFHPNFDQILAKILEVDRSGILVLIQGYSDWHEQFLKRFSQVFPDAEHRVLFLPSLDHEPFLQLMQLADVILDPPYFGGGNTSYEAFALDQPIVTWPGPFMRGRVTLGLYQQMGIFDCVAHDATSYVQIALNLAHDPEFRARMRQQISENKHQIFECQGFIDEVGQFFTEAVHVASQQCVEI